MFHSSHGWKNLRYTAHYTVPDWQCLHSGLGHGVRAHQDVLKEAHSGILCILPIRYSSVVPLPGFGPGEETLGERRGCHNITSGLPPLGCGLNVGLKARPPMCHCTTVGTRIPHLWQGCGCGCRHKWGNRTGHRGVVLLVSIVGKPLEASISIWKMHWWLLSEVALGVIPWAMLNVMVVLWCICCPLRSA